MSTTKYLDLTGLQYLKQKMDEKYVTSADVETAINGALWTYNQDIVTIVSSLPSTGEEGYLYLVPDSNASSNNVYTTWAWEGSSWAQMGSTSLTITVDSTVIEDSTNAVSGGAVYDELASKLDASELTSSISEGGTNAVTSGAIYDALELKLDASELTDSISQNGTNAVTSGAIYDALALKLDSADVESIENSDIDALFGSQYTID